MIIITNEPFPALKVLDYLKDLIEILYFFYSMCHNLGNHDAPMFCLWTPHILKILIPE